MKDLSKLKQIHDVLMRQAQAVTAVVNPQAIIQHGHMPTDKMLVMIADSQGLLMVAQAQIIEVLVDVLEPKALQ